MTYSRGLKEMVRRAFGTKRRRIGLTLTKDVLKKNGLLLAEMTVHHRLPKTSHEGMYSSSSSFC